MISMNTEIMNKINEYSETDYTNLIQSIINLEQSELSNEVTAKLYNRYINNCLQDSRKILIQDVK